MGFYSIFCITFVVWLNVALNQITAQTTTNMAPAGPTSKTTDGAITNSGGTTRPTTDGQNVTLTTETTTVPPSNGTTMTSPTMTRTVMTTTEGQNVTLTTETKTPPLNNDATTIPPSNGTTMTSPTMTRTVMTTTEGQNFTLTTETKTPPLNDDATTVPPSNGTTMTSPAMIRTVMTTTVGQNFTSTTETKTPPLNNDATTIPPSNGTTMTSPTMTTTEGQNVTLTTETKTPPLNNDATKIPPSNGTTMTSPTMTRAVMATTEGQNLTLTPETKTPPLNDDATTVQSIPEGTTYPKTSEALNLDGTTVAGISTEVLTTSSCGLNCENNGELLKESCECLCQSGFAGVNCEVSTEKNPCTENPDLCPERGQYCESDTKITDGKEYVCKCNSLEGYVQKDGKCIEEEPFTTKLDVTRIDGIDATYKPAHRDINSAESRKVLDAVIPVIRMSLKNDPATETVIDVVGIRLENGSIGVTTMVIFPKEENVKEGDLTKVLKKEKLGNASVEIELKQEKFNVSKPQSAGCSSKYCSNDGTCRLGGVFPDLRPSCSCARDFYGPTCDSVVLTPFIIAMITFGTVAFLILAGVLVFCLFVRARGGRHKAGEKVSRADRLYASAWKTGPDILSHYLTEELDDKEADSETELSSVSDERMDQLVKDLKGSSFQMKRAKSVYQWESVKFNKPPSQPRYADNPSMLELKNSRDRRWYTSSNI